jgi:hypothetical protein
LKAAHASDIALAQAIERELILALEKHRGIPSDAMDKSTPRTQYERALSGRDRVWCGNIATIFQYACVSLGVEARLIFTGSDPQPVANRTKFLSVENHATVEVYSRENEAWFWLDPTGYVLEAKIGGAPITLLQAVEALGTPLEPKIQVTTFDAAKKQSFILPLSESPPAAFMKNYFRPGVRLKF